MGTVCHMANMADRLRQVRERAGFESAREAARAFGWNENTYKSHESGIRGIPHERIKRYAAAFRVSPAWLWNGDGSPDQVTVPIVGYVGAGQEITPIDDHEKGGGLEEIEAPPGVTSGVVAVRVRGDSMYPAYLDGDTLFYSRKTVDLGECVGRECIVRLRDGRSFVKTLQRGTQPNTVTLMSHNAPPLWDVEADWIAPVEWVKKA